MPLKINPITSFGLSETQPNDPMNVNDLIFTGFNRRVAALDRKSGELIWQWKSPNSGGYGLVTLLLEGDLLIVAVDGYHYALNPLNGMTIWTNEMAGIGTGATCLVSMSHPTGQSRVQATSSYISASST